MKKKLLALLVGALMCFSLVGCGKDKGLGDSAQRERKDAAKKVEADIKETDDSIADEKFNLDDSVVEKYEGTVVDEGVKSDYTVEILDDGSVKILEMYQSNKNCYSTYTYFADSYEKEDEYIKIPFRYDDGSFINFKVYLDDNGAITKVIENYDDDSDTSKIAGTYTRKDDDNYGDMTLTVDNEGGAVLETEEMTYYGVIYIFDGEWDFVGDNDKDDVLDYDLVESVDLYIYFDNDSFTYKSYAETRYENYAGTYKMVGDLGNISLSVDGAGNASCTATVEGQTMNFTGSFDYYEDSYTNDTTYDAYLTSDDGMYSLSLSFVDLGDGTYNYQGSVSKTLGAG